MSLQSAAKGQNRQSILAVGNTRSIKLRTVISDHDAFSRQKLRNLLSTEPFIEIVAECSDLRSTQAAISEVNPDLLLVSVELPDGSGFNAVEELDPQDAPIVIFTSSVKHHALCAFEARALDYLLKPFDRDRLHDAVERARLEFVRTHGSTLTTQLLDLLKQPTAMTPTPEERFVIKARGRIIFVNTDEIQYIEGAANYLLVHAGKTAYRLRETLRSVLARLDSAKFGRIHRSFIVNVKHVKELQPCGRGEYMAILESGKQLPCSRRYRSAIQAFR
jgi:two-component system LytT family response regulator